MGKDTIELLIEILTPRYFETDTCLMSTLTRILLPDKAQQKHAQALYDLARRYHKRKLCIKLRFIHNRNMSISGMVSLLHICVVFFGVYLVAVQLGHIDFSKYCIDDVPSCLII